MSLNTGTRFAFNRFLSILNCSGKSGKSKLASRAGWASFVSECVFSRITIIARWISDYIRVDISIVYTGTSKKMYKGSRPLAGQIENSVKKLQVELNPPSGVFIVSFDVFMSFRGNSEWLKRDLWIDFNEILKLSSISWQRI